MQTSLADDRRTLQDILAEIVGEERDFDGRCRQAELDDRRLAKEHAYAVSHIGEIGDHAKVRSAHEAMFKVHRKIRKQHRGLVNHALMISSRIDNEELSDREIGWELRRMREALSRMKLEHRIIEQERRKILKDHRRIVGRLDKRH